MLAGRITYSLTVHETIPDSYRYKDSTLQARTRKEAETIKEELAARKRWRVKEEAAAKKEAAATRRGGGGDQKRRQQKEEAAAKEGGTSGRGGGGEER